MDLSRLVAPEGEKTVLMVGEDHHQPMLEETFALCEAFRPDAVVIELDADRLMRGIKTDTFISPRRYEAPLLESLLSLERAFSAMEVAALYAAHHGIPLYFADWLPTNSDNLGDYFSGKAPMFVYTQKEHRLGWKGIAKMLEETIGKLFGKDELFEVECTIGPELSQELKWGDDEEEKARKRYHLYSGTPHATALRNEYSAMMLNNLDEKRILYVGGVGHFRPRTHFKRILRREYDFVPPLQELVDARHRYYVDLPAQEWPDDHDDALEELGTEEFPMEVTETKQIALAWENLEYIKQDTRREEVS